VTAATRTEVEHALSRREAETIEVDGEHR
jgi:hypothetical protein